jgi:hypothetical protein
MRRRRLLKVTASATALSAFAGCTQTGERGTEEPTDSQTDTDAPGSQPGTNDTDSQGTEATDIADGSTGSEGAESEVGWSSGGRMNGVDFSFSSRSPECGEGEDDVDISFDDDAGEIVLDGVISGSDLCKRAQLASVEHDEDEDKLTATIETTDREDCEDGDVAAGQCLVDIEYEATFTFEDEVPSEASVSHGNGFGASAAHGSSSASASTSKRITETDD